MMRIYSPPASSGSSWCCSREKAALGGSSGSSSRSETTRAYHHHAFVVTTRRHYHYPVPSLSTSPSALPPSSSLRHLPLVSSPSIHEPRHHHHHHYQQQQQQQQQYLTTYLNKSTSFYTGLPRKSADNAASSSATLRNPNLVAERPRSHLAQSCRFDPRNVQKVVLEWCQNRTANYPNVKITNFSSSWSDGLAFCALIHSFMPDSFDYNKLNTHNKRYNFELAFETAYKQANIVPLLEASDMLLMGSRPDEKCVFTYLSTIYTRFNSNKANGANSSSSSSSTSSSTSDIQ